MFYANRGMITENLIENTIKWYLFQQKAWFTKRHVPIKIQNRFNENQISGKVIAHGGVDYYGLYEGRHIEFEVKETKNDNFVLSNLKIHQYYQLQTIAQYGGIAFLLIHFTAYEAIWFLPIENLLKIKQKKIKQLNYKEMQKYAFFLKIIYPGVVDFLMYISKNNKKII